MKKTERKPKLLTYLLSQIERGIIPTQEELEDIFTELAQKHYKEVAFALLPHCGTPSRRVEAVIEAPRELSRVEQPKPQVERKPRLKQTIDPKQVLTPGQLSKSSNVLGNG